MKLDVTRKSDLAAQALIALSTAGRKMKAEELAEEIGATKGFVPQVLAPLIARGYVGSEPGPTGGYFLRISLDSISVLDVVEAVEGPTDDGRCVLRDGICDPMDPCTLHHAWHDARQLLAYTLASESLADFVSARERSRRIRAEHQAKIGPPANQAAGRINS